MCTCTVIPLGATGDYALAFNRDEQRTRVPGEPPAPHQAGAWRALWPLDPASGGTWLGVNEAALTLALLNVYTPAADAIAAEPWGTRLSRGRLIPQLLAQDTVAAALAAAAALDPTRYSPFTLVAVDGAAVGTLRWDGARVRQQPGEPAGGPWLWCSSGLGDALVDAPRRALFADWFPATAPESWLERQPAFHRHSWPEQPELSVCMRRADACTVSYQQVVVRGDRIDLAHLNEPPDGGHDPQSWHLSRRPRG